MCRSGYPPAGDSKSDDARSLCEILAADLKREITEPVLAAKNILIAANIAIFVLQKQGQLSIHEKCATLEKSSVSDSQISTAFAVLCSFFSHSDWAHLAGNMFSLDLHVRGLNSSEEWRPGVLKFLLLYFGSGVTGFWTAVGVSSLHHRELQGVLRAAEEQSPLLLRNWLGDKLGWNGAMQGLSRWGAKISHSFEIAAIISNKKCSRLGASGCVEGVVGSFVTSVGLSLISSPRRISAPSFWGWIAVAVVGAEGFLSEWMALPWTISALKCELGQAISSGTGRIDHAAHVGGFFFGVSLSIATFVLPTCIHLISR